MLYNRYSAEVKEIMSKYTDLYEVKKYKEGKILLSAGNISNHLYYIRSGIIKLYSYNEELMKSFTVAFFSEDEFLIPHRSFVEDLSLRLNLQVIRDAELSVVSKNNWKILQAKEPRLTELFNLIALDTMDKFVVYAHDLCYNNSRRYKLAMERMPYLKNINDEEIADYLITSREIVNKIKNNKY